MTTFFRKPARYTPLQIAVHVYAWSVLVLIALDFLTGRMSVNPIQELEQRTGRQALTLLVLSLACTPLNTLFRWPELIKRRRTLGLYAFLYAASHVIIFVDLDYGLAAHRRHLEDSAHYFSTRWFHDASVCTGARIGYIFSLAGWAYGWSSPLNRPRRTKLTRKTGSAREPTVRKRT